jgi:hypothetical protein
MFSSFSPERTPNVHAGLRQGPLTIFPPKILKFLHQLVRLANECIEQSQIGIIRDGRVEPVCLPKGAHEHQPLFHWARRTLDLHSDHGCQFS